MHRQGEGQGQGQEGVPEEGRRGLPDLAVEAVIGHAVDVGQPVVGAHAHGVSAWHQVHLQELAGSQGRRGGA